MTIRTAAITLGITVTFMFHCFSNSLASSRYLSLFSPSFSFTLWSARMAKPTIRQLLFCFFLFFVFLLWQGLVVWPILWDPFVSQNPTKMYVSDFSRRDFGWFIYHILLTFFFSLWMFYLWFFYCIINDSRSPQVSRTLQSILVDFC